MYNREEIMKQAPVLVTKDKELLQAYEMALKNLLEINTVSCDSKVYNKSGMLDESLGMMIRAGGGYETPWTRDAAVNTMNAACFLEPEVAKNTLWAVCERVDGKLCFQMDNQCWDKIIWATGAWKYYLATEDVEFLKDAFETIKNSVEVLEQTRWNEEYGLFVGGSFFNDGITGYPKDLYEKGKEETRSFVGDHAPTEKIMSFSTNCLYYHGYVVLDKMYAILTKGESAKETDFAKKAENLKDTLNRLFWDDAKGTYAYLLYPDGRLDWSQEGCGISFAMWFDVCNKEQVQKIMQNCYRSKHGIMSIWPPFEGVSSVERPVRHNNLIWPVVNGFFMQAVAKWGFADILGDELKNMALLAINNDSFWEIYNGDSGKPDGGWQVGHHWDSVKDQTWSATGFLAGLAFGVFGITLAEDSITIQPCMPKNMGAMQLKGIRFRNAILDIELKEGFLENPVVTINGEKTNKIVYTAGEVQTYQVVCG